MSVQAFFLPTVHLQSLCHVEYLRFLKCFLSDPTLIFLDAFNVFRVSCGELSTRSDKKMNIFPIDLNVKFFTTFSNVMPLHDVAECGQNLSLRFSGKIFIFCHILLEF